MDRPIDAIVAGGVARRFASDHLADRRLAGNFAIVAAELASNIAHHSEGGMLSFERTRDALVIEAIDRGGRPRGPVRRGLGIGEGAVTRLADRVEIRVAVGGGREIRAVLLWPEDSP